MRGGADLGQGAGLVQALAEHVARIDEHQIMTLGPAFQVTVETDRTGHGGGQQAGDLHQADRRRPGVERADGALRKISQGAGPVGVEQGIGQTRDQIRVQPARP